MIKEGNTTEARPADRLGFTLFIAAVLHALLIIGVTFTQPTPDTRSKSLEITLATQPSEKPPEQADFLAQHDQQGSGTLDHQAAPETPLESPFQSSEIVETLPQPEAASPPPTEQEKPAIVSSSRPAPEQVSRTPPPTPVEPTPSTSFTLDSLRTQATEIATLEARLSDSRQEYARRPRKHIINSASTMRDKGAYYKEDWRRKVERIGNQNYPAEARSQRIYGSLRMLVSINRDGSLREVEILESSGHALLDEAALRIVRLGAPYAPFTGDLADVDILEIIRTWRFEPGDRMSSR